RDTERQLEQGADGLGVQRRRFWASATSNVVEGHREGVGALREPSTRGATDFGISAQGQPNLGGTSVSPEAVELAGGFPLRVTRRGGISRLGVLARLVIVEDPRTGCEVWICSTSGLHRAPVPWRFRPRYRPARCAVA